MNTKQHGQIVLLFACMFGVSLAQTPQSDLESGGREAVNAFEGMPAVYGLESLHGGVLEENSLWTDGLENTGKKVCIHRDKLIVYSTAAMEHAQ